MENRRAGIGQEIHRVSHMIARNLAFYVKASGIDENTLMHGWIIRYLYENRERDIFQKDIERTFSIGRSTVTGIIQILEKKGYIRRESVVHDARLKKVLLTEEGIKNYESINCIIMRLEEMLEEGIDEAELEVFFHVMDKINTNIKKTNLEFKKGGIECCEQFCNR